MPEPQVFVVVGVAGSGKSTIARELAHQLNAIYLDKDTVVSGLTGLCLEASGHAATDRENNDFYRRVVMPVEYSTLWQIASQNLGVGNAVVLDAPFVFFFDDDAYLQRVAQDHDLHGAVPIIVRVEVSPEHLRQRLIDRKNPRDTWKLSNWDAFWAASMTQICRWAGARHLFVDNAGAHSPAELVGEIVTSTKAL